MRTAIRYLVSIFVVYIVFSVLVILPALNIITPRLVKAELGRELSSEIILFNPFTLAVEIRQATLLEPDGETFLSVDSARVDLSLESIWNKGLVLDAVEVESLYVHVRRLADGNFNFSDMLGESPKPEEQADTELPGLTIHRLALHSDQIKLTDEGREDPFSTHWDGLAVSVQDLSTIFEEGRPYRFDAVDESGGKLHWEGVVSVPGAYSEGTLAIENISLHPIWRFARDWLAFELKEGTVSVVGDYRLDWGSELAYRVRNGAISIDNIDIQPRDRQDLPETAVGLQAIELSGIEVDGQEERVEVAAVEITGVDLQGFSEGSEVSLSSLFAASFPESEKDPQGGTGESENNWTVYAASVHLNESRLRWRSEYTSPPVLEVSPLDLQLKELHWPPQGNSSLSLSLTVNDITGLEITGDIALANGSGQLRYQVEKIQLAMANPNIPAALQAEITSGEVSAQGELILAEFVPTRVTMNGRSNNFSGNIATEEDAILSWDSVRWQELDLNLAQSRVELKSLSLFGYSGRLHIYPDGTINTQRVLQEEAAAAAEEDTPDTDATNEWTFDIPIISFTDSQLSFRDESLPISFGTIIGELNGIISGLSSNPDDEATIDLKGSVDEYAPVILAGTISPFAEAPAMDLGLSFDGIDLIRLTPYSGNYAGYAIDRGILNLDLHYSLEGSRLKGDNTIVVNQLKLGEKIDSDAAVDLPLELAIALLTDMNGVINMDVPVSGDMGDPEFSLAGVIFSSFANIISKAVTAPFALLASLVGSDDDMQRIPFPSGSSELNEAAMSRLSQLVEAMAQRPGLDLVLLGRLHPTADRERLQRNFLEEALVAEGLSAQEVASKGALWAAAIQARYKRLGSAGGANQDDSELFVHEQYQQLVAAVDISDEQLQALSEERAVSVKRYLVNELQFAAERSAIELVAVDDEANVFSGVELGVGI